MRRFHAPAGGLSALTAPLTSPFFHAIEPSESCVRPVKGSPPQNQGTNMQKSNRGFSDAATRTRQNLW
jgi:hypothetical protein